MNKNIKLILIPIILLNLIVLLGQLWPEGVPPFARIVNILTLVSNLIFFIAFLIRYKS